MVPSDRVAYPWLRGFRNTATAPSPANLWTVQLSIPQTDGWKHTLDQLSRRYANSSWRLPVISLSLALVYFGTFYMVRGLRGLLLSAGLLGGIGVFVLCFANPLPTLFAALFLGLSTLDVYLPGPVSSGLLAIVLARVLFDLLGGHRLDLGTAVFRSSLAILITICISSLFFVRRMDYAFVELQLLFIGLTYLVCISYLIDRPARILMLLKTAIFGYVVSFAFISQEMIMAGGLAMLGTRYAPRLSAGGFDPNIASMMSVCLFPFAVFLVAESRRFMRVFWLAVTLILGLAVVMSASRMGMGILGIVLFLLTFHYRKLALLAVAAAISVAAFLPQEYWTRFVSLGQLGGIVVDRSLQLRQHALETAWDLFTSHPFTGIGIGNVHAESGRYMSVPKVAHNTYIGTLASLGIFGFLAYAAWFGSGVTMAMRSLRLARIEKRDTPKTLTWMLLVSFLALLIAFTTLDLAFHLMVWLLIALANVMRHTAEKGTPWNEVPSVVDSDET